MPGWLVPLALELGCLRTLGIPAVIGNYKGGVWELNKMVRYSIAECSAAMTVSAAAAQHPFTLRILAVTLLPVNMVTLLPVSMVAAESTVTPSIPAWTVQAW